MSLIQHILNGSFATRKDCGQDRGQNCWRNLRPGLWLSLLQICTSLTLISRGWLMFRWDSHIRGLCWQEEWWTPWIEKFSDSTWDDYAQHSDAYITQGIEYAGIALITTGLLCLVMRIPRLGWLKWLLIPAMLVVALDAFGNLVDKDYDAAMAMEYALQVGTPLLLLLALKLPGKAHLWGWLAMLLAGVCFFGHGLYAAGHYPVPWIFQTMTMKILSLPEARALQLLSIAGVLDFIVALAVFIPTFRRPALHYMVLWGIATSVARVLAHYNPAQKYNGLDPWIAEMLVRTSHWMIPLLVLALLQHKALKTAETPPRQTSST